MEPETATVFDIAQMHDKYGISLIINDGEVIDVAIELNQIKTTAKSCTS